MEWYSRYLYSIVLSILNVHSSAVVLKNEHLNWRDADEACQLINFSQVKTEYKKIINEMVQEISVTSNSGYWIQDAVTEFSVVNKGCQKNVTIVESTTIEKNMLSNCFQFCQNNANLTTIGVKGNNCSCLNSTASDTYLPIDGCDILCVWEDRLCEMATVFSVFERQDSIGTLSGSRIEECITIGYNLASKLNCSSQNAYICQKNGNLNEFSDKVTWMEALSKCAEQNQTLAYYQPSSYKFNNIRRRAYRNWIGIRQFYQTEPVKQGSSSCTVIRRYNDVDINVEYSDCGDNKKYICLKEIQGTQTSLTVAFLSGGAIGIVLLSSVMIVIVIKRRRRNLPKKKGNTDYEERIDQSDDKDHEYAGIERIDQSDDKDHEYAGIERIDQSDDKEHEYAGLEHISNLSDGDFTKVSSVSENIIPNNTAREGHYEEASTSPDENGHEYDQLKMVQMSLQD